jgi:glycosyltransferase involved in cell wall biosynthesis
VQVAFDHQIFAWQRYGGISRYFWELATSLGSIAGVEPIIVAPMYMNRYLQSGYPVRLIGRRVPMIPKGGRVLAALSALKARQLLKTMEPPVVHETYYSRRRIAPERSKLVVTVHDMIHEKLGPTSSFFDRTSQWKRKAVERADHVICVSENTRRDLIELFSISEAKTSVVYHGCRSLSSGDYKNSARLQKSKKPYLLFVGQRSGYKNFDALLRAYASCRHLRENFNVVCVGGGALTRSEQARLRQLSIRDDRVLQISGPDQQLALIYRDAAVLVYPSIYEGFGMPPLEAMAAGCPVVSADRGSLPEVCGDAAEYCNPDDHEAIAEAIERVVSSRDRRDSLVEKGLANVRHFTWQDCARKTAGIYQGLVEGG